MGTPRGTGPSPSDTTDQTETPSSSSAASSLPGSSLTRRATILGVVGAGILGVGRQHLGSSGATEESGQNDTTAGGRLDTPGKTTSKQPPQVRFALDTTLLGTDIEADYRPVFEYLESELAVELRAKPVSSSAKAVEQLSAGAVDLVDGPKHLPVTASKLTDVVGIRVAYGSAWAFSLITTTTDSDIETLADLTNSRVEFGTERSITGALVPLLMLTEAGLAVGGAPATPPPDFFDRYSGDTLARFHLIARPTTAAVGTAAFATAPHVPPEQLDQLSAQFADLSAEYESAGTERPRLDLLAVSDPIPRRPVLARQGWDDGIRAEITDTLLGAPPPVFQHEDDTAGKRAWFSGLVEGSAADYEPIDRLFERLTVDSTSL